MSGTNGNGIAYYFQDISASNKVSLCSYNLKTNKEHVICSDWLTKFNNSANGQAIGMIEEVYAELNVPGKKVLKLSSSGIMERKL